MASSVILDNNVKSDTPTSFFGDIEFGLLIPDFAGAACCFALVRPPFDNRHGD